MPIIKSKINPRSADFIANAAHMKTQVEDLRALVTKNKLGGGVERQERHQSKGKLLVWDRIDGLLDTGSPFLEIGQLAAHNVYQDEEVPAAGLIAGVGRVANQELSLIHI